MITLLMTSVIYVSVRH